MSIEELEGQLLPVVKAQLGAELTPAMTTMMDGFRARGSIAEDDFVDLVRTERGTSCANRRRSVAAGYAAGGRDECRGRFGRGGGTNAAACACAAARGRPDLAHPSQVRQRGRFVVQLRTLQRRSLSGAALGVGTAKASMSKWKSFSTSVRWRRARARRRCAGLTACQGRDRVMRGLFDTVCEGNESMSVEQLAQLLNDASKAREELDSTSAQRAASPLDSRNLAVRGAPRAPAATARETGVRLPTTRS